MEIFCKDLKNQTMKIINYEKNKKIILTNEEKESYENQNCYICGKEFCMDKKNKEFKQKQKVRDHDYYTGKYRGAAHSICNLRYKIPREIPVGSIYDHHFITENLANEFKGNFACLGENTEKYIALSAPIKKDFDDDKAIAYNLKFTDNFRFMDRSLASLVDNLSEINKKKSMDEFIDNFRSMLASLSCHLNNLSEIQKINILMTLDLCYFHYHILLMIYLKLIRKNQKINLLIALDLRRHYY